MNEPDMVNTPPHYKKGAVECIDAVASAIIGTPAFEGHCVASAMQYLWRYNDKGEPLKDVLKAKWYVEKLIQTIEGRKK